MNDPNIIVLGAGGFVGRQIFEALKVRFPNTKGLLRGDFDIGNPETYATYNFKNTTVIDCIAQIDGDFEALTRNNFDSLRRFADYIRGHATPARYIYLSTTAADGAPSENAYVRSKQLAEDYLLQALPASRILRLSFPFGKGEKSNRLISRLILRIKNGEKLKLDNVTLNLTPVAFLTDHIEEIIFSDRPVINFGDGNPSKLHDIVERLHVSIGKSPDYVLNSERIVDLEVKNPTLFKNVHNLDDALEEMAANVG